MSNWVLDFYRQNEWANLALIDACRPLTDGQLDATVLGTFGSIRDTFSHIVSAEGGFAFRLGNEPTRRLLHDDPWPGFDALAEMVTAAADALAVVSQSAPDRNIRVGSDDGEKFEVESGVILIQAFHHSTEHRSQICTVLTSIHIEPPELSSWDWGLASNRMRRV